MLLINAHPASGGNTQSSVACKYNCVVNFSVECTGGALHRRIHKHSGLAGLLKSSLLAPWSPRAYSLCNSSVLCTTRFCIEMSFLPQARNLNVRLDLRCLYLQRWTFGTCCPMTCRKKSALFALSKTSVEPPLFARVLGWLQQMSSQNWRYLRIPSGALSTLNSNTNSTGSASTFLGVSWSWAYQNLGNGQTEAVLQKPHIKFKLMCPKQVHVFPAYITTKLDDLNSSLDWVCWTRLTHWFLMKTCLILCTRLHAHVSFACRHIQDVSESIGPILS